MAQPGLVDSVSSSPESKLRAILNVCQKINSERNIDSLLELLVNEAGRLLGAERATIYLLDGEKNELVSRAAIGRKDPVRVDVRLGVAGVAATTGKTINVADVARDKRFNGAIDRQTGYTTSNLLAVPLVSSDGKTIGAFEILNKRGGPFSADDEEILRSLAANAAVAIQTTQLIAELSENRRELAIENRHLWREVGSRLASHNIVGGSEPIQEILALVNRISDSDVGVLITGESGTGKDLIARAVHYSSPRARFPFLALNCAALPETLLESELFGVEKGVATGVEKRIGKFEAAHNGTLFLDEIGDLSLPAQAKILRVLQEHVVEHLGGRQSISVDVRVVAATNKDLEAEIEKGRFREDLFYRLNIVHIQTPALRSIREDIPLLAGYFLNQFYREMNREPGRISVDAMELLTCYNWPGNVRQLQNEMKRLSVCARQKVILPEDLSPRIRESASVEARSRDAGSRDTNGTHKTLAEEIADLEMRRIRETLASTNNNQQRTARVLGLSRQGLINKMKRYGLAAN